MSGGAGIPPHQTKRGQEMLRPAILLSSASVAALATLAFAPGAMAQEAGNTRVEEIIVTAQKREQNLQDVPIVVTAVGGQLLQDSGARDIKDLTVLSPGLTVTSTTSEASTTARIRGVGTVGDNPGLESSVGVTIDGVYRPRNGVGFGDLGETERIEILKGPQGTLFGKSTSAGVINIITAAPSFEFGASGELTVSNYNGYGLSASVTGPIAEDKVAGRLYFAHRKRDGFLDVITGPGPRTETEDNDQDFWTLRGQILFQPNDNVSIRNIVDYTKREENCCNAVQLEVGISPVSRANLVTATRPGSLDLTPDPFARVAYGNRSTINEIEDMGVSTQIDIGMGWADLTSITAFRTWSNDSGQESDFTAADIYYRPAGQFKSQFDTFSQELRLGGATERLDWLVGLFFAKEEYHGESPLIFGSDYYGYLAGRVLGGAPALVGILPSNTFIPGTGQRDTFDQQNTTWALFTNNTFDLTERWDVTVGLRYTYDEKELRSQFTTTGGSCNQGRAAFPALAGVVGAAQAATIVGGLCLPWENQGFDALSGAQNRDEQEWSGTIKTSFDWTDDIMTYASYARGYKAGGFNFDRPNTTFSVGATGFNIAYAPSTSFRPETVDAFELGAKTSWFDNTLVINAAYFNQKYEDFQLNTFLGTRFIVESIPELTSEGVDMDFLWRGVEGLTVQGGVTYANTEYATFTAAQLVDPSAFAGLNRLPGSRASFAPEWSSSISATYEHSISDALLARGNISVKYMSDFNTGSDLAPQKAQSAFTVVNARVGVGSQDKRWMLEAWALNLTDEEYIQVGFNSPLQGLETDPAAIRTYSAFLGAPRTYGLTLRLNY
jgi:iron complex outermembrane recepter protein